MRPLSVSRVALALSALLLAASPAGAASGVAPSDGTGRTEAEACQSAKANGPFAVSRQRSIQGETGATRVTGFSACQCSYDPDAANSMAREHMAWQCTVNVEYEETGEE